MGLKIKAFSQNFTVLVVNNTVVIDPYVVVTVRLRTLQLVSVSSGRVGIRAWMHAFCPHSLPDVHAL